MKEPQFGRLGASLTALWVAAMTVLLLVGMAAGFRYPDLPIHLGALKASGYWAVCATAIPAVCGVWALLGLLQNRPATPFLLLAFSVYWIVVLVGALLEAAWRLPAQGWGHATPWIWLIRIVTFGVLVACPALVARWALAKVRPSRRAFS
jgi:hypothetical protein